MKNVSVFVSSCDAYEYIWRPFCYGLKKYWPDCPWPVYFLTNYLDPPCGEALKVGPDNDWTTTQKKALDQISSKVILFILDDCWLEDRVDTKSLIEFSNLILKDKADFIHLTNFHDEKKTVVDTDIDSRLRGYSRKSMYRTSLQGGLWKVSTFIDLMVNGETAWDFETKGNDRSKSSPYTFLNVKEHKYLPYLIRPSACSRGTWTQMAKDYSKRERLNIDFSIPPRKGKI